MKCVAACVLTARFQFIATWLLVKFQVARREPSRSSLLGLGAIDDLEFELFPSTGLPHLVVVQMKGVGNSTTFVLSMSLFITCA